MEFILKFDNGKPLAKAEAKPEIKVKDMFVIEEAPDTVISEINVYDLCKTPFYYAFDKVEMLSWIQPHSTDIAITNLSKANWRKELDGIIAILGFRSSIYIMDNEGVHDSVVESWLQRHGFRVAKEGRIMDFKVFEYEKGLELSVIDCFNPSYTLDIFSIVFVSSISYDTVVYCDVPELIDIFFYACKNDKNIFMPIPFSEAEYVDNYLNSKPEETTKVNKNMEFKLF